MIGTNRPVLALLILNNDGIRWNVRAATDLPPPADRVRRTVDWNLMREAWRYNADRWPAIEAECSKYGAEVLVLPLSRDREIHDFLDAS
jgi:hypothetical protein